MKKPCLYPIIKNEAAVISDVIDLCSDDDDEEPKPNEDSSSMDIDAIVDTMISLLGKERASTPIAAKSAETATKTASPKVAMALPLPADVYDDANTDSVTNTQSKPSAAGVTGLWAREENAGLTSAVANTCTSTLGKRDWVDIALKLKRKEVSSSKNIDTIVDAISSLLEKKCTGTPTIAVAAAETTTKTVSPDVATALPHPHLADVHDNDDTNSVTTDTQSKPRAAEVVGRWTRAEDAELANAVAYTKKNKWGKRDWIGIAALVQGRAKNQCRNRWQNTLKPSIDKATGHSGVWEEDEDLKLRHALQVYCGKDGKDWFAIASLVSGQTKNQCTGRRDIASNHTIDPVTGHSKIWTEEEDKKLKDSVQMHGGKGWVAIAELVVGRSSKQCYNRWRSVLDHSIDRTTARSGKWTEEEDKKLKNSIEMHGNKNWGVIGALVPGRTVTQCRNRWNNALNQNKKSVFELMMA
jgi:hypothetical protein